MGGFRALLAVGLAACGGAKMAVPRPAPTVAASTAAPSASVPASFGVAVSGPAATGAAVAGAAVSGAAAKPAAMPRGAVAREPCLVLRELAEAARRSFPKEQPAPELAPCLTGEGGAYSYAIRYTEDATDGYGPGYVAELVLLHADEMGRVARSHGLSASRTATYATSYELHGLADYDGDGTDELLLDVSDWEFEGNGDYDAQLWHVAGERLEPYAPAEKIAFTRFADVDHDGLPDLLVATPFRGVINGCGADGTEIEFGPSWPMHAQSGGGFGFDDVSRAEVLRTCPRLPARIVPPTAGGVDNDELRRRLACAVAWGVKSDAIARELERDCPTPQAPLDECSYEGVLPGCVNLTQLVKWAAAKAPFTLR